jgi:hypothetical protein
MKRLCSAAILSILAVLATLTCAYGIRYDGPYNGRVIDADKGGRVCLDNLKQFLSDKLLRLMPLPASEVVYSSKHHPVFFGQGSDAAACCYKTQNSL